MMDKTIITKPLQINTLTENAQLDARSVITTLAEMEHIQCPYEGLLVYCKADQKTYQVTQIEDVVESGIRVGYKIKSYTQLNSTPINYLGEFTTIPSNPENGDWYRNPSSGESYIYQSGEWVLLSHDGNNGTNGSFLIYVFKNSESTPDTPSYVDDNYVPGVPEAPEGWYLTTPAVSLGEYIWMSCAYITQMTTSVVWSTPVRLSGEDGVIGADGASIEFIYAATSGKYGESGVSAPELNIPHDWETNDEYQTTAYLPSGWDSSALPVSPDNRTVWVSSRISKIENNRQIWQPFTTPVPWSVWGANGVDGDGTAYIYCTSSLSPSQFIDGDEDWDNVLSFTEDEIELGKHQSYDSIPAYATTGLYETRNWTDNPDSVSQLGKYTYVAIRRKYGNSWETSFTRPKLWSYYSDSVYRLSLSKPNLVVICDRNGRPLNSQDGIHIITKYVDFAVYSGNTNITSECTFTISSTTADTVLGDNISANDLVYQHSMTGYAIPIYGFTTVEQTSATITITAHHPDFGIISEQLIVDKQLSQSYSYNLRCSHFAGVLSDNSAVSGGPLSVITYQFYSGGDLPGIQSVSPESCVLTATKIDESFSESDNITELPDYLNVIVDVYDYEGQSDRNILDAGLNAKIDLVALLESRLNEVAMLTFALLDVTTGYCLGQISISCIETPQFAQTAHEVQTTVVDSISATCRIQNDESTGSSVKLLEQDKNIVVNLWYNRVDEDQTSDPDGVIATGQLELHDILRSESATINAQSLALQGGDTDVILDKDSLRFIDTDSSTTYSYNQIAANGGNFDIYADTLTLRGQINIDVTALPDESAASSGDLYVSSDGTLKVKIS